MKISTFFTVCLFISTYVSAQNIEWTKSLGNLNYNYKSFLLTDDFRNAWIYYSLTDSTYTTSVTFLKKYNLGGILLSTDTLPSGIKIYSVKSSGHSTFYIAFNSNDSSLQLGGQYVGYGFFIAEMDYNNVWSNIHILSPSRLAYDDISDYQFDAVGNSYIAAIYYDNFVCHCSFSHLFKFDSLGNLVYYFEGMPHSQGETIQPLSDGNWYAITTPGHSGTGIYLDKLDTAGNLLWRNNLLSFLPELAADDSANLFITGSFINSIQLGPFFLLDSSSQNKIYITKVDSSNNFLWALKMSCNGNLTMKPFCDPKNQRLYLFGDFTDSLYFNGVVYQPQDTGTNHSNFFLASFDLNGNLSWETTIYSSNFVSPVSLTSDQRGRVIVDGFFRDSLFVSPPLVSTPTGSRNVFIMNIADQTNSIETISLKNSISIYPNPADKFINIKIPENNYSNVRITSIDGKNVRGFCNLQNNFQIPVSDLADGIYILTATGNEQIPISSKIIVLHNRN